MERINVSKTIPSQYIHDPIPPKGKGMENIKATMAEAYAAVESALPEKYKGMIKNEDQDR